ncbi:spore germination protein [Alkalihalobacterium alkalinitrilicum]|uniref:spore germination protein n=1 Tax=Alkalihalobacterium alkalinitrilicum TaxID=427920 RepID=UPI000995A24E|nr:spore germination protein [Alkalihalobacterium alkalinitrilicum]
MSLLRNLGVGKHRVKRTEAHNLQSPDELIENDQEQKEISTYLKFNKKQVQNTFEGNFDFLQEEITFGEQTGVIIYLKTMVDLAMMTKQVKETLLAIKDDTVLRTTDQFNSFFKVYFSNHECYVIKYEHEVTWYVLSGFAVILLEGIHQGIAVNVATTNDRDITVSETQTIVRGPQHSFTEAINTNVSLIRRKVKNPHLKFESCTIGTETKTDVYIGYINNISNSDIVNEVRKRVTQVKINAIYDSGNLEELITDQTLTPFPLTYHTDRPDTIASHLIDGKVIILVDGSPFVISAPVVFVDFFQVSEDAYQRFMLSTFIRLIRYLAFFLALALPAIYVALTTFHHGLVPTDLLISIQAQREGLPFPAVLELLLMEITFEILREAGVRMPRVVGQTVSIVGALVIGQAAVEAGIVSNFLIIIVALTAMASFVSPIYSFANSVRLVRFGLILITAALGMFGTLVGLIALLLHLISLRSFGVPYFAPLGPFIIEDQKDVFIRLPFQKTNRRPSYINPQTMDNSKESGG